MANQPIPGPSNPHPIAGGLGIGAVPAGPPSPDGYIPMNPGQVRAMHEQLAARAQEWRPQPTLMQTLDNDAREALKLTAAMQFPKRVVDLAAPVITAFAKNAGGKAGVLKAKAIIALLRSDTGQMILMGVAGIGLVYLPTGNSARREYVKREIAPRMRQLAMGKGLDKLIDEILGPVMEAIDEVGTQLMAAMPAEALPAGFESGLRVDPAATPEEAPVAAQTPAPATAQRA